MSEFGLLSAAADGMSVQRALLDVAAHNVAAAQASDPAHPYPRMIARFTARDPEEASGDDAGDEAATAFAGTFPTGETADALTEMVAVLDAQRAYEANASVFEVGKKLAERTLDVGRV